MNTPCWQRTSRARSQGKKYLLVWCAQESFEVTYRPMYRIVIRSIFILLSENWGIMKVHGRLTKSYQEQRCFVSKRWNGQTCPASNDYGSLVWRTGRKQRDPVRPVRSLQYTSMEMVAWTRTVDTVDKEMWGETTEK